jgi:non-ribosomal peptide synthetase component F
MHRFHLPEGLTERLRLRCREERATPFMVLLAAFNVLLYRWTGQSDLVVGTDVANRTQPQTEELIGFFLNHLVIRTDLSGDPSFRALLGRVREECLGAYAR